MRKPRLYLSKNLGWVARHHPWLTISQSDWLFDLCLQLDELNGVVI